MGKVVIPIEVLPRRSSRERATIEALVDTGATLSMIPSAVLRRLGIQPMERMRLRLANGRVVQREVGEARLKVDGHVVTSRVIFGRSHDATVLGLVVLESLGLAVDPSQGKLTKGEALLLVASQHSEGPCESGWSR